MKIPKILIISFLINIHFFSLAQLNNPYAENIKRIDAYVNGPLKIYSCAEGMVFPAKYKTSKIKSDTYIASFINGINDSKITDADVAVLLKKTKKKGGIIISESNSGLISTKKILLKGNYLRANIIIEFIDHIVIRSKVTLTTITRGQCGSHGHLLDFKVIRDFFIKDLKLLFNVGYDEITSDTIYFNNLTFLTEQHKEYKFSIPGSDTDDWINKILEKQYQSDSIGAYNYDQAPESFVKLIKENKNN